MTDAMSAKTVMDWTRKILCQRIFLYDRPAELKVGLWGAESRVKSGDFLAGKVEDHSEAEA